MKMLSRILTSATLFVVIICGCFAEESLIAATVDNTSLEAESLRNRRIRDFQVCELYPKGQYGCYFIFGQSKFPEIKWRTPDLVEKIIGAFPLKVRWFDAELSEVGIPEKAGRYAAVIDAITPKGIHIRRAMTVYHRPKDWLPWKENPKVYVEYLPSSPFDKAAWEERKDLIASCSGKLFFELLTNEAQGPVLLSYLTEMKPLGTKLAKTDTPKIIDNDYHLALKRKLLGVKNKYPPLKMPHKLKGKPASVLRPGTSAEAAVKSDTAKSIRTICQQWYADSKEPFVVLVARHGVIIIHEAYGEEPHGPVTVDTPMYVASLTKLITGVMFAQFIDQGLIALDDPVGKFLPDFPIEGDKAVTLRHCFTHTSGLEGHLKWGGMHNPWLDNVIANGLSYLKPGKKFKYNGMGYDLAGKVMEIVGGKSIFRLMYENFFEPLGVEDTSMDDMASSTTTTAEDLARIGQLLLNKGSYGNLKFFSPETFEKLLPQPLNRFYPAITEERGVGLCWMRHRVIGHDGGNRCRLHVDLDNDLVIVQIRNRQGTAYNKYL
ncbi:MAG: beta-lactamase family protein, partial [Planctomycetes bacterium]|nr:beta-lactamase family protein [Planctomycetota bacterium]